MVGAEAEHSGIIRAGARFVEAMATAKVPKIVLTVNHASGAGYYAMAGQGFDPDFIFSLPTGRMGVMEGDSAVQAIFGTQLEKLKKRRQRARRRAARAEMEKVRANLRPRTRRQTRRRPRPRRCDRHARECPRLADPGLADLFEYDHAPHRRVCVVTLPLADPIDAAGIKTSGIRCMRTFFRQAVPKKTFKLEFFHVSSALFAALLPPRLALNSNVFSACNIKPPDRVLASGVCRDSGIEKAEGPRRRRRGWGLCSARCGTGTMRCSFRGRWCRWSARG